MCHHAYVALPVPIFRFACLSPCLRPCLLVCLLACLQVLHTLSAQRVHRVYVLDPAKDTPHVLGIVTPTDVLQVLLAAHDRHELN